MCTLSIWKGKEKMRKTKRNEKNREESKNGEWKLFQHNALKAHSSYIFHTAAVHSSFSSFYSHFLLLVISHTKSLFAQQQQNSSSTGKLHATFLVYRLFRFIHFGPRYILWIALGVNAASITIFSRIEFLHTEQSKV